MSSAPRSVRLTSTCCCIDPSVLKRTNVDVAQPTFLDYYKLADRPAVYASTNGVFQTGGVIGTLTLLISTTPGEPTKRVC